MHKVKLYEIPLYRGYLAVIVTDNLRKLKKLIPEYTRDDIFASTYLTTINEFRTIATIFNPADSSHLTHGIISHEAYHAASFILDFAGHVSEFNDEPTAYLTEWCTDRITENIPKEFIHPKI